MKRLPVAVVIALVAVLAGCVATPRYSSASVVVKDVEAGTTPEGYPYVSGTIHNAGTQLETGTIAVQATWYDESNLFAGSVAVRVESLGPGSSTRFTLVLQHVVDVAGHGLILIYDRRYRPL